MLLIQNGTVVDPASGLHARKDVLIDGNQIRRIADFHALSSDLPAAGLSADQVLNAEGCIVAPGLVDTHSHFRDPGFTWKENIHTGSLAAARGGYTSIVMMANTNPVIDCVEVLEDVLRRGAQEQIHIYSAANVTRGMNGEERTDFVSLAAAGAVVFTDDGKPVMNETLLENALKLARKLDRPISLHEEDPAYVANPGINAGGPAAAAMHLTGADRLAESTLIERDCRLAVRNGSKLCIQHISSAEGVELVRQARKRNPEIHAEATPHHFTLTEEAVLSRGTLAKVNPPLRLASDRQAVLDGIADGTIDIIATDHAPHAAEEKARPFTSAPSGMIGLETALSLGIRSLVNAGCITMDRLLAMLTCNPADYYRLPAGHLRENGPADLVIFNPDETWTVAVPFASRSSNSPFIGDVLPGVIHYTIADGRIIYQQH